MDGDQKPKLYIVLYSLYHHVYKLAIEIAKGAEASGCEVKIFQVEETLSNDILDKLRAPDRPDLPIITAAQLAEADGFLFGLPTRFGMFPTQVKTLLDATGSLWAKNGLAQKFAGFFISTASLHGGSVLHLQKEILISRLDFSLITALTAVSYLVHHGINYISFGYPNPALFDNSKVIGGTPYGSTTIANGDGSRQPIEEELDLALNQGENFGKILTTYHRGLKNQQIDKTSEEVKANNVPNTNRENAVPSVTIGATAGAVAAAAGGSGMVAAATSAAKKSSSNEPGRTLKTSPGGDDANAGDGSFYGSVMDALSSESSGVPKTHASLATATQGAPPSDITNSQQQSKPTHATKDTEQIAGTFGSPVRENPLDNRRRDEQPVQQSQNITQQAHKKKRLLWFCCGNSNDLD
ncbi:unnamed protein product [Absidia cylindrospora]